MVRVVLLVTVLSLPTLADDYLVVTRDLPAGSELTAEVISHKESTAKIPGGAKVDSLQYVLGGKARLIAPLKKGDLLMWFVVSTDTSVNERCNKAASPR